jgi:hypothetical protein
VVIGNGAGAVNATSAGTAGQALRSGGASADPSFGEIPQTTTSTGTVNDFALTAGAAVLRCNNASLLTITGITAGFDCQRLVIVSVGAGQVDLSHQAAGSTAANRLINFATSAATSLAAGVGTAEFEYDATTARWRLITHEQGAWITPTYAGGNYTASGSQTWTVDSGDIAAQKYWLRGRSLLISFALDSTSVGGTPSTDLKIGNGAWGGFSAASQANAPLAFIVDAGVTVTAFGMMQISAAGTALRLLKSAFANWGAATNTTQVYGQITIEVT